MEIQKKQKMQWVFFVLGMALILGVLFIGFVGKCYAGDTNYAIMSSTYFGMPEYLQNDVHLPYTYLWTENNQQVGWDGQFYYYISNDLLGIKDTANHIDYDAYRYQRVGLPLLAWIISKLLFRKYVSVSVFLIVNYMILLLGIVVATRYFQKQKYSILWVTPWVLSTGVVLTGFNGLPDGAADALFIIALIMLLENKKVMYSFAMTFACLCRESYVLLAFLIFVLCICGKIENIKLINIKEKAVYHKNFFVMALPGIVFIVWYMYVTIHFHAAPFQQAKEIGITKPFLTVWPEHFKNACVSNNNVEVVGLILYLLLIVTGIILSVIAGKKILYIIFFSHIFT